jgi:hypothetical protein
MPFLTRRKDPHRADRWNVYFGDISVGAIGRCAGVPLHVDQWEWSCGLQPNTAGGTAETFEAAREAFAAAWAKLEPGITPDDYAAHRRQRAFTEWKYAMHDAGLPLPTQLTSGRSKCFCGAGIDIAGVDSHVAAAHLETT